MKGEMKMRILYFLLAFVIVSLILVFTHGMASETQVHYEDFNGSLGSSTGYTGINNQPDVGGYAGIGTGSNTFGGNFAHNYGSGNPAPAIELNLTGLAAHTPAST